MSDLASIFSAYQTAVLTDDAEQTKNAAAQAAAKAEAANADETLKHRKLAVSDLKTAVDALDELGNAPAPAPVVPQPAAAPAAA